jgi:hypothetical protein
MSNDDFYTIEDIRNHRIVNGKEIHCYVKWFGYPENENTWQPIEQLMEDTPTTALEYFKKLGYTVRKVKPFHCLV